LEHQIFASVVGTGTVIMTGVAGRAAFNPRTGLIAAALAAVYPNIFLYEHEVLSEPLALLGVATTIWLAYRFIARPSLGLAVALGATIGLTTMTKSDQFAIAVLLGAPIILTRWSVPLRRRVTWLASAALIGAVIIAPWSIYLSTHFDRPVLVSGALGHALESGNCPDAYSGDAVGYYALTCAFGFGTKGDPIDQDTAARHRALHYMRERPGRAAVVAAARVGRTFGVYRPFQTARFETDRSSKLWIIELGFFAYWALLPFAIAGLVIARRRKVPVYPLLVYPLLVFLTVLPAIGSVRYRAPAEIPLVILAAVTIEVLVRKVQHRTRAPEAALTTPSDEAL
jgi:4-amino-4-deoxy-L-arabinose transferase-like glycosyltransferase